MVRKFARYVMLTLIAIISSVLILILVSVAPLDRTPAKEFQGYDVTLKRIDELHLDTAVPHHSYSAGFGKKNITPGSPVSTAGYGKRKGKKYEVVHDSVFVRTTVIDNGSAKVAIVSLDLLVVPPTVTQALPPRLAKIGFSLDNTYLAATHSHNSIGHWGEGAMRLIYGAYSDSIVNFIADGIVESIMRADSDKQPSSIRSGKTAVPDAVQNRLLDNGPEDPWLRILEITRTDNTKAVIVSFAAHATCLSTGTLQLSRDYPGYLVDALEDNGYDFAMFMAGSVGSHKGSAPENDWGCVSWMGNKLADACLAARPHLREVRDSIIIMARVKLSLSDPQVKISENWKLRSWFFRAAFGEYEASLAVLRIGDLIMLGAPCDFSGEFNAGLDSVASELSRQVMVTSFNGGYIGYLTPMEYYDVDHYETRLMNWYAPGTGEYVRDCFEKLIIAVSDTN